MKVPKTVKVLLLVISFSLFSFVGIVIAQSNTDITDQKTSSVTVDVYTEGQTADTILDAKKYLKMNENEIEESLKQLSKKQLIDELNFLTSTFKEEGDINALIPFVSVLFQRKDEFEDSDFINVIKDDVSTITMKEIMVDLYAVKNENKSNGDEKIKQLLKEKNIDKEIKARIVANSEFSNNDINTLEVLIQEDDGILAFKSLKQLAKIDDEKAYIISSRILSNYKYESKEKVMASLKSTAKYLKHNKDKDLENEFIKLSFEIIENNDDNVLKDAALFSVSDLMSKDAISEIIKNKSVDRELKVFSIDQNFMTLKDILINNPTESDIEIVVEAMELMPIVDLLEDIEKVMDNIKDKNLQQRCKAAIENTKLNGHKGNEKWKYYYGIGVK